MYFLVIDFRYLSLSLEFSVMNRYVDTQDEC